MILTKKFEILRELPKCDTKTESKENCANRLAQQRVATNLQSVKNILSTECNQVKLNKMKSACTQFCL